VPRVQAKAPRRRIEQPKPFVYTQAICIESFSIGWSDPIPKGRIYPRDHWAVQAHPIYWRLVGPQPDQEGGE
jgi:hypothetical protein